MSMKIFRSAPRNIFVNLGQAMAFCAVTGTILYSIIYGLPPDADTSLGSRAVDAFALLVPVAGVCVLALFLYAYPALAILSRVRYAGPGSAMIVALFPALVFAAAPDLRSLALVLGGFGAVAGTFFVLRAYPRGVT